LDKPKGWWIFNSKRFYLLDGSMMNQCWLIVTELMKRRKDLNDEFLWPYRRKLEKSLSIPEQIVEDADLEIREKNFDTFLNQWGIRRLEEDEEIDRG
tara:strand:+ start:255 stop:545 length:291 start_codon:yes stop_codon:yes gene_type:complete